MNQVQSLTEATSQEEHQVHKPSVWRPVRSLIGNAAVVFLSNGILKASNAVLFIAVVHLLGRNAAGQFSISTTVVSITLNLALFGLDEVLMREAARPGNHARMFANLLLVRLVLTLLFALILDALLVWSHLYSAELTRLIILLSAGQVGDGVLLLCQAMFISQERVKPVLALSTLTSGLRIAIGLCLLTSGGDLAQLILLFVITSAVGAGLATWLVAQKILGLDLFTLPTMTNVRYASQWLRQSGPFFWISLFIMIEFQIDVVLLSVLKSLADVALYTAAQTIIIAVWIIPQAYRMVIYPRMAVAKAESFPEFWGFFKTAVGLSAILGIAVCAGLVLSSKLLISLLYPQDYKISVLILQFFTIPLFFAFLGAPSSRAMLVLHREAMAAVFWGASMLINVIANLALIPQYGPIGAVSARVLSGGVFCALSYIDLLFARQRSMSRPEADV